MKRLSMLAVAALALTWAAGCCHSRDWRCHEWGDECCRDGCDPYGGGEECGDEDCCRRDRRGRDRCRPSDCCDPCGGSGATYAAPAAAPSAGSYDANAMLGAPGCTGCGTGTTFGGTVGATYNGMPIDPSSGWVIQSTPLPSGAEPVQAPPAANSSALVPVPASPASSGSERPATPIAPPVGTAR